MITDSLAQIANRIKPIAIKHRIPAVYVFGSYATGRASEQSDVDLLIDREGSEIKSLFQLSELCDELEEALDKKIDLLTVQQLQTPRAKQRIPFMVDAIEKDKVKIYG